MYYHHNLLFLKQNFAKKLVNADRTALFLVENRTKELYARVFDMGDAYDEDDPKPPPAQKEIRFDNRYCHYDALMLCGHRSWSLGIKKCMHSSVTVVGWGGKSAAIET